MFFQCLSLAIVLWLAQGSTADMLKYINDAADPCDNFYEFACGKYNDHLPASNASKMFPNSYSMAMGEFNEQINQLLAAVKDSDSEAVKKIKAYYKSCMNAGSITDEDYEKKLSDIVKEFGQMPALEEQWQENNFDWLQTVAEISHKYGIKIIFGYSIVNDYQNHSAHQMFITAQPFEMDLMDRQSHEFKMVQNLQNWFDLEKDEAAQMVRDMIAFEALLWEGHLKSSDKEAVNVRTTVDDIHKKYYPALDFKKFMSTAYGDQYPGAVVLQMPKYLDTVVEAIKKTPKSTVANYIFYNLLTAFTMTVPATKPLLEGICTYNVQLNFPQIVSSMFYKANDFKQREQAIQDMFKDIKVAGKIIKIATQTGTFLKKSWEYAYNKMDLMQLKVATYEKNNFDEEYQELKMNDHDLVENWKSSMAFRAQKLRASFNMPPKYVDKWLSLHAITTSVETNTIIVPVSMLQSDYFWSPAHTRAESYGNLGMFIARQVINGISGTVYQVPNGLNFPQYWRERDLVLHTEYADIEACFNEQYRDFVVKQGNSFWSMFMPKPNYLGDNGGLFLANAAYRRWYDDEKRSKPELESEKMPNGKYSPQQVFFIAFAQTQCERVYPNVQPMAIAGSVPSKYVVNVPLSNLEQFSKEFNCAAGSSAMNPAKKCQMY